MGLNTTEVCYVFFRSVIDYYVLLTCVWWVELENILCHQMAVMKVFLVRNYFLNRCLSAFFLVLFYSQFSAVRTTDLNFMDASKRQALA